MGARIDPPGRARPNPPFAHTPYSGSTRPFSVGLAPLDLADWIEPDIHFATHLAEKDRLFNGAADEPVFRAEPDTQAAQREVLDLLLDHLPAYHSDIYEVSGTEIRLSGTGRAYPLADGQTPPLMQAARLVQEDLVLMRKGQNGYRLVAAVLCFPSSWSLAEKFGQSMFDIHVAVPGFNDGRMGPMVARIFDNLAVDRPSWRLNWSLYSDAQLHHPHPKALDASASDPHRVNTTQLSDDTDPAGGLYLRVERQTLRRLPKTGDILFTIKIHHDPIAAFARHPDGARLAGALRDQLLALDTRQLAYKGLTGTRDQVAGLLERLARP